MNNMMNYMLTELAPPEDADCLLPGAVEPQNCVTQNFGHSYRQFSRLNNE